MNSQIINPLMHKNWDNLMLENERCSIFHSSAWARVLADTYHYKAQYFCRFNGNSIQTLIPCMEVKSWLTGTKGVSLPFSDYCEIMAPDKTAYLEVFEDLMKYGTEKSWKYIDIRDRFFYDDDTIPARKFYTHQLDLNRSKEIIFKNFRPSTQRNIKKAESEGVTVEISSSKQDLLEFYRLHCLTRKRQGIPVQPFIFFKHIYNYVIKNGLGFFVSASHRDKVIASKIFLHFGRTSIFKFGAFDMKYQHLRPNNLTMWQAICRLQQQGCKQLSFGRTDYNHDGLRRFKLGWGVQEATARYYRYNLQTRKFVSAPLLYGRFGRIVMQKIPFALNKMIGSLTYKHIG